MDDMKFYELSPILKNLNVSVKNDWEIARQISYIIAQSQSTKKIKPSDIMQFPWDEGYKNRPKKDVKITKELRDRMIKEMEAVTGAQRITAYVPLSEMFGYATELRSRTQGRGQFTMQFDHFNECPKSSSEKIIGERAVKHDD